MSTLVDYYGNEIKSYTTLICIVTKLECIVYLDKGAGCWFAMYSDVPVGYDDETGKIKIGDLKIEFDPADSKNFIVKPVL